jgi:dTDP-4-dehydrorhamnose 3,5-epimerase
VADATRDASTVSTSGESRMVVPDGVIFRDAVTHVDDRGSLCELFDPRWGWSHEGLVYAYVTTLRPGMIKGWGMHLEHEDRYFILYGELEVVLYDDREGSPTRGLVSTIYLTELRRGLMNIPEGVWHAIRNVGNKDVTVINFPTKPYDHENPDKYRLPIDTDQIPHSFADRARGW